MLKRRYRNIESIESMMRKDRGNILIEQKFKSAKKQFRESYRNGKILFIIKFILIKLLVMIFLLFSGFQCLKNNQILC